MSTETDFEDLRKRVVLADVHHSTRLQPIVYETTVAVFKDGTPSMRMKRFMEEAIELFQAYGCTRDDIDSMINYVYNRKKGTIREEIGGTLVTLLAYAASERIDAQKVALEDLLRIIDNREACFAKHLAKP